MSELPPDPGRLQAILQFLDEQLADNETITTYLRLQRDAVRQALAATEGKENGDAPGGQPAGPRPPSARPVLEAPPTRRRQTGFVVDRARTANGAEPAAVHLDDCNLTSRLARAVPAEEARMAIAGGLEACAIGRPDAELGIFEG